MDKLKNQSPSFYQLIFGRFYFIYFTIIYLITLFIFYFICLFNTKKNKYQNAIFFHSLSQQWVKIIFTLCGIKLKKIQQEQLEKNQPVIFILNHRSFFDIFISTPYLPQPNLTIGKKSFSKIPLFGKIYKSGAILVDRKNSKSRAKSFLDLNQAIQNKISVCIYPEGTRNKSNQALLPFQQGAFKLAFQNHCPIVPIILFNTAKVMPANIPFYIYPHSIQFHILKSIHPKNFSNENELKEYCFHTMLEYYENNSN